MDWNQKNMANGVEAKVGCTVKACVGTVVALVAAIIVVAVVVQFGSSSSDNTVEVGDFDPPGREKRSVEGDLFETYWDKFYNNSTDIYNGTIPNSTSTEEVKEMNGNWRLGSDAVFAFVISSVSCFLLLAVIVLAYTSCVQRLALARLERGRRVEQPQNWMADQRFGLANTGFENENRLFRGRSVSAMSLDKTPTMVRVHRLKVAEDLKQKIPVSPEAGPTVGTRLPEIKESAWEEEMISGSIPTVTVDLPEDDHDQVPQSGSELLTVPAAASHTRPAPRGTDSRRARAVMRRATTAGVEYDPRQGLNIGGRPRRPLGLVLAPRDLDLVHDLDLAPNQQQVQADLVHDHDFAPNQQQVQAELHLNDRHGPATEFECFSKTTEFTYQG